MKNSKSIIGVLAVILLVTFGCKKDKEVKLETEQQFSVKMQKAAFKGENENAIVIGSKAELESAFSGKTERVFLKKASKTNNLFILTGGTKVPGPVVDPVGPIDFCSAEIDAYYADHIQLWQSMANENCKPYVTCITCPNSNTGLYVMFHIKPNSKKCAISDQMAVMFDFQPFGFGDDQYDGGGVAAVINPKR